jgi:hypothetical protein
MCEMPPKLQQALTDCYIFLYIDGFELVTEVYTVPQLPLACCGVVYKVQELRNENKKKIWHCITIKRSFYYDPLSSTS